MFGKYPQKNQEKKEDIEWMVLKRDENRLFLLSKYALDCKEYNKYYKDITWEECSLRKWLNKEFVNCAFSENEKDMISETFVTADKNPVYDNVNPGNDTTDKVFLLSMNELEEYLDNDIIKCAATEYSISKGVYVGSNSDYCYWWLRTPGCMQNCVVVAGDGKKVTLFSYGDRVNKVGYGIRLAIWINI